MIEEKKKISGFPTAKQLREAREVAEARIKREDGEVEKVGLKRKAKEQSGRASKKKAVEEDTIVDVRPPLIFYGFHYIDIQFRMRSFSALIANDSTSTSAIRYVRPSPLPPCCN